jgi:hypothetical protein
MTRNGAQPTKIQEKEGLSERVSGEFVAVLVNAQAASTAGEHVPVGSPNVERCIEQAGNWQIPNHFDKALLVYSPG